MSCENRASVTSYLICGWYLCYVNKDTSLVQREDEPALSSTIVLSVCTT